MIPDNILKDNTSGSTTITNMVAEWLSDEIHKLQPADYSKLISVIDMLAETFPYFASLHHLLNSVQDFLKHFHNRNSVQDLTVAFCRFIIKYNETWQHNQTKAAEQLVQYTDFKDKTLMLHSHSGSIVTLFRILAEKGVVVNIIQTVSEPAREGRKQAESLAAMGFQVRVINEAAASHFMHETDFLVTGADTIFQDYVVNKTGTLSLALLCRHFSRPWLVLCESRKFVATNLMLFGSAGLSETPKPADEIWHDPPDRIIPVNYYFEPVPRNLVSCIFTEQGFSG